MDWKPPQLDANKAPSGDQLNFGKVPVHSVRATACVKIRGEDEVEAPKSVAVGVLGIGEIIARCSVGIISDDVELGAGVVGGTCGAGEQDASKNITGKTVINKFLICVSSRQL